MRVVRITGEHPLPVYGSGTIYVYPLHGEAPVISGKAVAVGDFIIASHETPAHVKPPLDVLYHHTI